MTLHTIFAGGRKGTRRTAHTSLAHSSYNVHQIPEKILPEEVSIRDFLLAGIVLLDLIVPLIQRWGRC